MIGLRPKIILLFFLIYTPYYAFSGDTNPNKWFLSEVKDSDFFIHERYLSEKQMIRLKNYDPERARIVATVVHTSPSACGERSRATLGQQTGQRDKEDHSNDAQGQNFYPVMDISTGILRRARKWYEIILATIAPTPVPALNRPPASP